MKLWYMYRQAFGGHSPVGRDRFEAIVDRYGLKVRSRVRKPKTTDSTHGLPVYPNLLKDFLPDAPNQLWVSDITYITIWQNQYTYHFCYLSLILDAYTEEIVGWSVGPYPCNHLSDSLSQKGCKVSGNALRGGRPILLLWIASGQLFAGQPLL
ncbi:MAG: hypothetical protein LBF90_01035 [Prevotellaceae bacterium]|nr:hypothetical protein [Prevotellaceae bacterium]